MRSRWRPAVGSLRPESVMPAVMSPRLVSLLDSLALGDCSRDSSLVSADRGRPDETLGTLVLHRGPPRPRHQPVCLTEALTAIDTAMYAS